MLKIQHNVRCVSVVVRCSKEDKEAVLLVDLFFVCLFVFKVGYSLSALLLFLSFSPPTLKKHLALCSDKTSLNAATVVCGTEQPYNYLQSPN